MSRTKLRCSAKAQTLLWVLGLYISIFAASVSSAQTLNDAYRAELIRLEAEKSVMRTALANSTSKAKRARATLVREIKSLSRQLTRLQAENNTQETQVPHTSRLQSLQEQERNVERRTRQIETWLETHGVATPSVATPEKSEDAPHQHPPLDEMMKAALEHVEEHGQLWLRPNQEYFGIDGVATVGPVLRIAEVGAVLVDPQFRPLELASDGSLRLSPQRVEPSVEYGKGRLVGALLFDPDDIRPAATEAADWREWMNKGGTIMWVIGALAVLALLLFLERMSAYSRYVFRVWFAERRGPMAPIAGADWLLRAVAVIQTGRECTEELESQAAECLVQTQPIIRRGVSLLAVVAAVAPLLGLLGTVTGMIGTFAMITEHGTGDPRLLSGGISEALLTTQFGLMVAIPALIFQTTLYRCGDAILRRIERFAMKALREKGSKEGTLEVVSDAPTAVRSAL